MEPLVHQFVPTASSTEHYWKEPLSIYFASSHQGLIDIDEIFPKAISSPGWTLSELLSSPQRSSGTSPLSSLLPSIGEKQSCSLAYSGLSCTAGPRTRHSTQNAGCWNLSWPDGNNLPSAAENPTGILSIKGTFLAYIQLAFNQDFPVLFCKDTLRWMSPSKHQCQELFLPMWMTLHFWTDWKMQITCKSLHYKSYVKSLDPVISLMKLNSLFNVNFCFLSIGWFSSIIHHCKPYTIWNNSSVTRSFDYSHFCVF